MTTSQTSVRHADTTGRTANARPLRTFLALDAAVTAGNGLIYLLAAGPVGDLLDLNTGLLRGIGAFLTVYGILVAVLATRKVPAAGPTKAVIAANLLWAVASVATAVFGWFDPNTVGTVWILMQAAVVGGFAVLQINGLRRLSN
ncbi:hypothetical protein ABT001_34445 [Streptomyces sp. NPDC002793]|uniref:hypothetical protein n=1 Tax=Streptomyces sp. NPDC002793 TaxID=3154432 RepID=UPI003332D181